MAATRRKASVTETASTYEHVVSHALGRLLHIAEAWAGWLLTLVTSVVLHLAWPFALAAACTGVIGAALAVLAGHLTHHRRGVGRWLPSLSLACGFGWMAAAEMIGLSRTLLGVWFIGGIGVCSAWTAWRSFHADGTDAGLDRVFTRAAVVAGMDGAKIIRLERSEFKAEGTMQLAPGQVADDAVKAAARMEAGLKYPPGALLVTKDLDRADQARFTITDPRILRKPQPWPGPSRPGTSIAEPVCPGRWQDGVPVAYTVTNHHLQMMGASGVGKTEGGAWSEIGETVTRSDAAVVAVDITKGEQFLGPLRPALHRLETDGAGALGLLAGVHRAVRARTDYLATRGLGRWQEGCGLTHLTVWLEEAPDVVALLGDDAEELWLSDVKAARSAGIRWVISLQRSDWTQMPTLARGQLGKMCFGVLNDGDAAFGLSAYQKDHDCEPELWGDSHPGMAFLDAACIPQDRKAMPMRAWYWGKDTSLIAAHAARFPAAARPLDEVTAAALAAPPPVRQRGADLRKVDNGLHLEVDDMDDGLPLPGDVPDDDLADAGPDGDLDADIAAGGEAVDGWVFATPRAGERMDADGARREFRRQLAEWRLAGRPEFRLTDLADLRERTGRSRAWLYDVLAEAEADGEIERRGSHPATWLIGQAA